MAGGLRKVITDSTEGRKHCGAALGAADEGLCRHVVCVNDATVLGQTFRLWPRKVPVPLPPAGYLIGEMLVVSEGGIAIIFAGGTPFA